MARRKQHGGDGGPGLFGDDRPAEVVGPYGRPGLVVVPPSAPGSATSAAAAEQIGGVAGEQRRLVYEAVSLAKGDGLTREEIAAVTGLSGDSTRPRCWELLKLGWLVETTRTRTTAAGRKAAVLVAVDPGPDDGGESA